MNVGLIIGVDSFGKAVEKNLSFVDKSLFVKEIFDNEGTEVSVIVRPRRFGKTFNLSMLRHFLAEEVNGLKTQGMFDHLLISQQGDEYMRHQGQYPVIFISFKDMKHNSYDDAYRGLAGLMSATYAEHDALLSGNTLRDYERRIFEDILWKRASNEDLIASLLNLSSYLYRYYGTKPWLLIDEYDTPIQSGYLNNHYSEIIAFMRGLLGAALKGNDNLYRAVITGILRIAKENLFSGLNNVKVFSVLNAQYAMHFGFTETEVDTQLQKNNLQHLAIDIKDWYNGYHIGGYQIYNPWSIANCINDKGVLQPYWLNTSSNDLIKQAIARAGAKLKIAMEPILEGRSIEAMIDENITFADLDNSDDHLWSLLLFAGYLTSIKTELAGLQKKCLLKPPNKEIALLYPHIISTWFVETLGRQDYQCLLESLTAGNLEEFLDILQTFLFRSASYFDVSGNAPEKFYHGFVMGMVVSLSDTHLVQSNKESGRGRYDVLLIPKDKNKLGIIIEFKVAKSATVLQEAAQQALAQINARGYETELQHKGIVQILKIGLAFYEKEVAMVSDQ